jgi:hypothetical protein
VSLFKPGMVVDYRLTSSYDRLRQKLLTQLPERLDQPLAYWALPTDRHLPLALISRTLRDLLSCTLNELYSTPGIGPKKINSLIVLLSRATPPLPGETSGDPDVSPEAEQPERPASSFDAAAVSEPLWAQWRANVRRLQLQHESLGRFAATLETLPRTLWTTPLGTYLDLSLADIRKLRTHGHKRIAAVLEVFACLYDLGCRVQERPHLAVRFLPRRIAKLDGWLTGCIERPSLGTHEALQDSLVLPLLEQIQHDLGDQSRETVAALLRQRSRNLQEVARRVGLNRGSIYEILANLAAMLGVRWPDGQMRLGVLAHLLAQSPGAERQVKLLELLTAFYSPEADGGGDGLA